MHTRGRFPQHRANPKNSAPRGSRPSTADDADKLFAFSPSALIRAIGGKMPSTGHDRPGNEPPARWGLASVSRAKSCRYTDTARHVAILCRRGPSIIHRPNRTRASRQTKRSAPPQGFPQPAPFLSISRSTAGHTLSVAGVRWLSSSGQFSRIFFLCCSTLRSSPAYGVPLAEKVLGFTFS